ncbi:hypothetical protein Sango_0800700 [Sesamum angolense]|uniref:Integrase catalytic domain-containing protein n=1 Tax=Sesamum angolense TaxID=2727404 RepID=A0AAE1X363_9LAMI|nr:hypothetical protein Sango_0800700 [Sesamum angolense]
MITAVKKRKITMIIRDRSSIEEVEAIQWVEEKRSWKSDMEEYLVHGIEPTNPVAAKRLKLRVNRSLAQKVTRQGNFWPTLVKDAMEFTKKCQSCQRFGIPRILISDNGTHFQGKKIMEWCKELKIQQNFTIVGNPQANGQTEVSNRILLQHLKTRMDGAKGSWVEELLGVLWAYRTTPRTTTGETPICLVYGLEEVIPTEIGEETATVAQYNPEENEQARKIDLVTVEETQDRA